MEIKKSKLITLSLLITYMTSYAFITNSMDERKLQPDSESILLELPLETQQEIISSTARPLDLQNYLKFAQINKGLYATSLQLYQLELTKIIFTLLKSFSFNLASAFKKSEIMPSRITFDETNKFVKIIFESSIKSLYRLFKAENTLAQDLAPINLKLDVYLKLINSPVFKPDDFIPTLDYQFFSLSSYLNFVNDFELSEKIDKICRFDLSSNPLICLVDQTSEKLIALNSNKGYGINNLMLLLCLIENHSLIEKLLQKKDINLFASNPVDFDHFIMALFKSTKISPENGQRYILLIDIFIKYHLKITEDFYQFTSDEISSNQLHFNDEQKQGWAVILGKLEHLRPSLNN